MKYAPQDSRLLEIKLKKQCRQGSKSPFLHVIPNIWITLNLGLPQFLVI